MKPLTSAKILLVEDEPLLLKLLQAIFEREGLHVETAHDGIEAYEKISGTQYQVVVTDVKMPRLSGTELCHKVKTETHLPQPNIWVALTAHLPEGNDQSAPLAKFDESFYKPLNPALIAKIVVKKLIDLGFETDHN